MDLNLCFAGTGVIPDPLHTALLDDLGVAAGGNLHGICVGTADGLPGPVGFAEAYLESHGQSHSVMDNILGAVTRLSKLPSPRRLCVYWDNTTELRTAVDMALHMGLVVVDLCDAGTRIVSLVPLADSPAASEPDNIPIPKPDNTHIKENHTVATAEPATTYTRAKLEEMDSDEVQAASAAVGFDDAWWDDQDDWEVIYDAILERQGEGTVNDPAPAVAPEDLDVDRTPSAEDPMPVAASEPAPSSGAHLYTQAELERIGEEDGIAKLKAIAEYNDIVVEGQRPHKKTIITAILKHQADVVPSAETAEAPTRITRSAPAAAPTTTSPGVSADEVRTIVNEAVGPLADLLSYVVKGLDATAAIGGETRGAVDSQTNMLAEKLERLITVSTRTGPGTKPPRP